MVSMDQKRDTSYRCPDLKLFVRDVRDREGKKRPVTVRSWATVKDVKDRIQQLLKVQTSAQKLYFGPLLTSGKELPNHRRLHDIGIDSSGQTILLDIKNNIQSPERRSPADLSSRCKNNLNVTSCMMNSTPKPLLSLVQQARRGLAVGLKPDLALEGSGGTYFLKDSLKNKIAVFKPADEEPYADNNPRGYIRQSPGDSLRKGIAPGEACIREVAAFLLDHGGFASVPMTTLVEAQHPAFNTNGARLNVSQGGASMGSHSLLPPNGVKSFCPRPESVGLTKPGSFQEFVRHECTIDDISPSKISAEEIHKIAILDIRLMNADRNAANLMVRRCSDNTLELIPIDHGYCLRSVCDVSWMDWCWLDWPQLKKPLSEKHKKYIANLDIELDAQMLRDSLGICEQAIDYFRASSALLKAGVAAGLSLYDIAVMCCRNDDLGETPSMMEKLFDVAADLATVAVANERWHHSTASRALEDKLCSFNPVVPVTKIPCVANKKLFRKSASSVEFVTLASKAHPDSSSNQGEDSPALIQSNESDSETDEDDAIEDCEKWAEQVIADVSLDKITPLGRPFRSGSVSSASSDDTPSEYGECKGFWRVHPGQINPDDVPDDCSEDWSVEPSSHSNEMNGISEADNDEKDQERLSTPKVTFAEDPKRVSVAPSTVGVSEFKGTTLVPRKENCGMIRSKSYSGLVDAERGTRSESRVPYSFNLQTSEHAYKKYFHKFIDLVIVRETSAALRHPRTPLLF